MALETLHKSNEMLYKANDRLRKGSGSASALSAMLNPQPTMPIRRRLGWLRSTESTE